MAGTLKPVRITVACAYGDVGRIFTPSAMVRDFLIANRYAEFLPEAELPSRPVRMASRAMKKVTEGLKGLAGA